MSTLIWKRHISKYWPAKNNKRKIILLYHSVADTLWGMSKHKFQVQLDWLADHCRVVSLQELIQAKPCDDLQVAVTFDDGYQSLYDTVAPMLMSKKLNATVYLNTGWISENHQARKKSVAALGHYPDETFLTWPEVKNLYYAGWLIGSHGVNHHNFSLVEEKIIEKEFLQSKQEIEKRISTVCSHFAYPFGRYTNSVKQWTKKAGYKYAVAVRHGSVTKRSDLFALPRINIDKNYSFEDFKNIIRGKWDYLRFIHRVRGL